jgi:NADPH2:quinone reductase
MENTMRSVIIEKFDEPMQIKQVPIPSPKENEVLVKLHGTTINPSDQLFFKGHAFGIQLPSSAGFEGFGVVTAAGSEKNHNFVGKKVSFWSTQARSWSEYATVPVQDTIVMPDETQVEKGTFAYLNPVTCFGLLALAKEGNHKGIIITAAASQCGRILTRLCKEAGIKTINIVRRNELKDLCLESGADAILNSSDPEFEQQLKTNAEALNATFCADCIGGSLSAKIIELMPFGSKLYLYGFLANEVVLPINTFSLLLGYKTVSVFFVSFYVASLNEKDKEELHKNVIATLSTECKTVISKEFTIDQISEAVEFYEKNASLGKVLIKLD